MRLGVTVRETGWLLSRSEPQFAASKADRLAYVVRPTRLCP